MYVSEKAEEMDCLSYFETVNMGQSLSRILQVLCEVIYFCSKGPNFFQITTKVWGYIGLKMSSDCAIAFKT